MNFDDTCNGETDVTDLEHDAAWSTEPEFPELDWDESEVSLVVASVVGNSFAGVESDGS